MRADDPTFKVAVAINVMTAIGILTTRSLFEIAALQVGLAQLVFELSHDQ